MRILVGCEESQTVAKAFRELGHEAYSCDEQECSGGKPEWHFKGNVLDFIGEEYKWDLAIFHPPCTFFSRAAGKVCHRPERIEARKKAFEFVLKLWNSGIPKIAIENPPGWLCTNWQRPTQTFHPYYFGDREMKQTCLWLKDLPALKYSPVEKPIPVRSVKGKDGKMKNKYFVSKCKTAKERAKTFPSIAKAMAEQWGGDIRVQRAVGFF